MSPRHGALWLGALLIIVAFIIALVPTEATPPGQFTRDCGSVIVAEDTYVLDLTAAMGGTYASGYEAACDEARGTLRTWSLVVGGLGVLVLAGLLLVRWPDGSPLAKAQT